MESTNPILFRSPRGHIYGKAYCMEIGNDVYRCLLTKKQRDRWIESNDKMDATYFRYVEEVDYFVPIIPVIKLMNDVVEE